MARIPEEEDMIKQVGGRFRLATLLEKRSKELLFGARPYVGSDSTDLLSIPLEEIRQGKIELVTEAEGLAAISAALLGEGGISSEAEEERKAREALEKAQPKEEKPQYESAEKADEEEE